jgi:hypothetical protein
MKKVETEATEAADELRPEYDLKALRVRRLGPGRKSFGDVVRLEPDVAEAFPDADSVNEALRFLIRVTKENRPDLRPTKGNAWRQNTADAQIESDASPELAGQRL